MVISNSKINSWQSVYWWNGSHSNYYTNQVVNLLQAEFSDQYVGDGVRNNEFYWSQNGKLSAEIIVVNINIMETILPQIIHYWAFNETHTPVFRNTDV
jgi:hypothetical protein